MLDWILTSLRLLLGTASPRDLVASPRTLGLAAVSYALVSATDARGAWGEVAATTLALADVVVVVSVTALALAVGRRLHRMPQTLLAMAGTGIWFTLPSLGCRWLGLLPIGDAGHRIPVVVQALLMLVLAWAIVTVARIFRAALETDFQTGLAVSLSYFLVDYLALVVLPSRIFH